MSICSWVEDPGKPQILKETPPFRKLRKFDMGDESLCELLSPLLSKSISSNLREEGFISPHRLRGESTAAKKAC